MESQVETARTREEWLEARRTMLGASDSAAICGRSPYGNALSVYLDKKGLLPHVDSAPKRWGLKLEETVAEAYAEETGRTVGRRPQGFIDRHPQWPWIGCTLDRVCEDRLLELKTARSEWSERDGIRVREWGEPGSDRIPDGYLIQVQHQMAVTGDTLADVAVLIGGSDFRIYTVPANRLLQDALLEILIGFWRRLEACVPPEPDWEDPRTPELVQLLHRPVPEKRIELGSIDSDMVARLRDVNRIIRSANDEAKRLKGMLAEAMGDAGEAVCPDGTVLTRKRIHRGGYFVEACDYISMRIKEKKDE